MGETQDEPQPTQNTSLVGPRDAQSLMPSLLDLENRSHREGWLMNRFRDRGTWVLSDSHRAWERPHSGHLQFLKQFRHKDNLPWFFSALLTLLTTPNPQHNLINQHGIKPGRKKVIKCHLVPYKSSDWAAHGKVTGMRIELVDAAIIVMAYLTSPKFITAAGAQGRPPLLQPTCGSPSSHHLPGAPAPSAAV